MYVTWPTSPYDDVLVVPVGCVLLSDTLVAVNAVEVLYEPLAPTQSPTFIVNPLYEIGVLELVYTHTSAPLAVRTWKSPLEPKYVMYVTWPTSP